MATSRAFAYNVGAPISGTEQVGDLAVGTPDVGFEYSGLQFWNGPDEELGYVIAKPVPFNNQLTPLTITSQLFLSVTYRGNDIQISNGSKTANQLFGYQQSVLCENLIGASDKVMFSVLCELSEPATSPNSHFIGIGYNTMDFQGNPYGGYPGNSTDGMGYCSDGNIYYNGGAYESGLETWTNGDIIDILIDNNTNNLWVRVNGGYWNNNPSANPLTGSGSIETIGGPFYPVLCPGYQGTMTIKDNSAYNVPDGFLFLGRVLASVAFRRSATLTEASFLEEANNISGQNFATAVDAKTWLNNNGYWDSYSSFGSSGFQWMTINSITSNTAAGVGQNAITISITQSGGGMGTENGMYSAATFPQEYGVPLSGPQIQNNNSGIFTAVFSQPVYNALVAFASVGNGTLNVPVIVSAPFTPIWSQATTYQSPTGSSQYTRFTGTEGFNIIRIDGTASSVSFNYTVSESYSTICFGFVNQNV